MRSTAAMKFESREYALQMSSSLPDDGMLLELIDGPRETGEIVADVLYSDADGSMRLTQYRRSVPAAAIAWLREEAARRLPPIISSEPGAP